MSEQQKPYLVDVPDKEHEIIRRWPHLLIAAERVIWSSLNLDPHYSWYLLEVGMNELVGGFEGDVDILAGRLEFKEPEEFRKLLDQYARQKPQYHPTWWKLLASVETAETGDIKWPPSLNNLVGIETKCSYLANSGEMKSTKSSNGKVRQIKKEVGKLLKLGFNKVALLEFIANPPTSGEGSDAWLSAAGVASNSLDAMRDTYSQRLPADSPAGHGACSIGAVTGGDETLRGAITEMIWRQAAENPMLQNQETKAIRKEMEVGITAILEKLPQPRSFPVIFINCRTCCRIHSLSGFETCGKA